MPAGEGYLQGPQCWNSVQCPCLILEAPEVQVLPKSQASLREAGVPKKRVGRGRRLSRVPDEDRRELSIGRGWGHSLSLGYFPGWSRLWG